MHMPETGPESLGTQMQAGPPRNPPPTTVHRQLAQISLFIGAPQQENQFLSLLFPRYCCCRWLVPVPPGGRVN